MFIRPYSLHFSLIEHLLVLFSWATYRETIIEHNINCEPASWFSLSFVLGEGGGVEYWVVAI